MVVELLKADNSLYKPTKYTLRIAHYIKMRIYTYLQLCTWRTGFDVKLMFEHLVPL